ncbi:MAG: transcriptional regulator NrdR [Oscillospiraceae bacterium]|nr:transcriptional regulator NrdR [Oscillospiraceae bacterium]
MNCPFCGFDESKVIDSRPTDDGEKIRRRRECLSCQNRFTTYEVIETTPLMVIKKDKSRQAFDRQKLLGGLMRACEKRPVSLQTLEQVVNDIEHGFKNAFVKEVSSNEIGELTMKKLRDIDLVAYVRFASVYREFSNLDEFMQELKFLKSKK